MKCKKTLVLAASIFALTLSAFPHHAAASSNTTPPNSGSQLVRMPGKNPCPYMQVVPAVSILLSALLP